MVEDARKRLQPRYAAPLAPAAALAVAVVALAVRGRHCFRTYGNKNRRCAGVKEALAKAGAT
jgi:hypothetical protein